MLRTALAALLLTAAPALAQSAPTLSAAARQALGLSTEAGAAAYAEGRDATLAFRLGEARAAFARVARAEPASLAGAYGLETAALWEALVAERDAERDRFYALNDSLTDLADRLPDGPESDLWTATASLHRAILLGRQERYSKAGLTFRGACGTYRDLAALPSPAPDALFGQGLCEVAAGAVPRKYKWLARLLGFSGTVAGGTEHLVAASEGDGVQGVEATVALSIVDRTLNEGRGSGLERIQALAAIHPESPILAYFLGYQLLTDRRPVEAEVALRRSAEALAAPGATPLPFIDAHLGTALFRQGRFEEAISHLEGFARSFRGDALVANTMLMAGIAYEMTGDRPRAEALYRRVRARRDYDIDLAAARQAALRLATPMTPAGRVLVLGETAYDSGRYQDAIDRLQPIVTDASLPDIDRAEAAYRTGRAYQALRKWDDALRHFQLATARPGDPQAKWGPWALYHTGEVHEAAGDKEPARRAYRAVLDNEAEFDFSKSLEQRTRTALERLDR